MVEFFLSFLACIVILVGLFFGFFILLGVLRGLPYIFRGLAARWSDDPTEDVDLFVRTPKLPELRRPNGTVVPAIRCRRRRPPITITQALLIGVAAILATCFIIPFFVH